MAQQHLMYQNQLRPLGVAFLALEQIQHHYPASGYWYSNIPHFVGWPIATISIHQAALPNAHPPTELCLNTGIEPTPYPGTDYFANSLIH